MRVSLILPARNEERLIEQCLRSVCALEYPDLEILVVDDCSTDATAARAEAYRQAYRGPHALRLLRAPADPPEGWVGKTFAADYAIAQSSGEIVIVCDVDVEHSPASLTNTVAEMQRSGASLLSRIPLLTIRSATECPLVIWVSLLQLSSRFVQAFGSRQSFAMGMYLAFTRAFYEASGGWQAHRAFPESLPLLNYCLERRERFVLMDDRGELRARMYEGGAATWRGLVRNVNFRLVQPLPFLCFFGCTALLSLAISFAAQGVLGALYILGALIAASAAYLRQRGYPVRVALWAAALLPLFPFYCLAVALAAAARHMWTIPVQWRGRTMYVQ